MGTSAEHVMTIANSIIGVSVLAMPFCFKQCGIVLSILLLLLSGIMTRLACHYLLKSAITARRRNFEFLAFHAFGPTGKLFVELGIIGFMLGTCIAFFVVMGDLGPVIIGPALNIDTFSTLRPSVLMGLALLVVLPLGLLKNVDSLSAVCAASIAFYLCLVFKVMAEATTHLISWDWIDKVNLWRPAGVPQCIPIFAMALSCQTQLFEIFDSVPNTSLEKMNSIIRSAINMCTAVYISVGLFGYIAFCTQNFSGNLLMSFPPTMTSEIIKLGFVLSVAVSFPLVIFPCRASLHSLLFRRSHTPHHELLSGSGNYIPEPRFKCLTIFIVMFSLGTGLLIPSIEVVLGLVGSTIGIMICIMFPALTFICISNKNNNERLVAQGLFAIGFMIMILGSYTNLYATEEAISKPSVEIQKAILPPLKQPSNIVDVLPEVPNVIKDKPKILDEKLINGLSDVVKDVKTPKPIEIKKDNTVPERISEEADSNKRKEPPIPVAPGDTVVKEVKEDSLPPVPSILSENKEKKTEQRNEKVNEKPDNTVVEIKKEERISNDAIKREEEEIKESKDAASDVQKKNEEILLKLTKHEEEQKKILQEQKALLEELKKQNQKQQQQQQQQNNLIVNQDKNIREDKFLNKVADERSEITKGIDRLENKVESPKQMQIKKVEEVIVDNKIDKSPDINLSKNLPVKNVVNNNNAVEEKSVPVKPSLKDTNLTPIMANKMANGVPLPLAVKDVVENNSAAAVKDTNQLKKIDDSMNNKPKVRDILGENKNSDKEEREKRDLDTVVKMDESVNVIKPKFDAAFIEKGVNKERVVPDDIVNHVDENINNDVKQHVHDKNSKGNSLINVLNEEKKNEKENCPKPETEKGIDKLDINDKKDDSLPVSIVKLEENAVKNKEEVKQVTINEQDLIKTPSHLSDPEVPRIDTANIEAGNPVRNSIPEMKPLSRDLKSVQNVEDNRQEERAAEIT